MLHLRFVSFPVSHTTADLIFKWNLTDPLVVNPDIELPQLDITRNDTEDCTLEYSTGTLSCYDLKKVRNSGIIN